MSRWVAHPAHAVVRLIVVAELQADDVDQPNEFDLDRLIVGIAI